MYTNGLTHSASSAFEKSLSRQFGSGSAGFLQQFLFFSKLMLKRDYYILRSIFCYNLRRSLLHFTAAFFRVTNYVKPLLQLMAAFYYNLR